MICRFIDSHKKRFGVEPICRVLSEHGCKIAPSTYYAWRARRPSDRDIHDAYVRNSIFDLRFTLDQSTGSWKATPVSLYGYRKTWHLLRATGMVVARSTVARIMREAGWRGVVRGRGVRTTIPAADGKRAGDLLNRQFAAPNPNHTWIADFTYVRTWTGFVYVAYIVDVYSQRIVGWHAQRNMKADLVTTALRMAIWMRNHSGHPIESGLIHHSDAGSQYTSLRFTERLTLEDIAPSIGSVGDAYDNALMESIIGLYKTECIETDIFHSGPYRALEDVEFVTATWVDWYNNDRLHSSLGYTQPVTFEARYHAAKSDTDTLITASN